MLGIVIGTGSLIAMLSIGAGAQTRITAQIGALGANMLVALPGTERGAADGSARPAPLTAADAAAIAASVPEVTAAAPALEGEARLVAGNRNWATRITGTTSDYFFIRDWPVASGRAFSATYQAAGSARVVPTTMAMGEGAGVAAAVCVLRGASPHDLPERQDLVREVQRRLVRAGAVIDF